MSRIRSQAPVPPARKSRLGRDFFAQPTLDVARQLLGKSIVRTIDREIRVGTIIETEAYKAPRDLASHASKGRRTPRVEPIYGEAGTLYVYLCYGIHELLNIATVARDVPECVLIRGVVFEGRVLSGPGKVTKALAIDRSLNGIDCTTAEAFAVVDDGVRVARRSIIAGPRVGIDYAGPYWAARPWRFRLDLRAPPIRRP